MKAINQAGRKPITWVKKEGNWPIKPKILFILLIISCGSGEPIFKRPTVLGGMGVGDAHNGIGSNAEAILPINQLPKLLGLDKMQNSGVTLSIENFNNNTDRDIEYLANELAYFMKRKALV